MRTTTARANSAALNRRRRPSESSMVMKSLDSPCKRQAEKKYSELRADHTAKRGSKRQMRAKVRRSTRRKRRRKTAKNRKNTKSIRNTRGDGIRPAAAKAKKLRPSPRPNKSHSTARQRTKKTPISSARPSASNNKLKVCRKSSKIAKWKKSKIKNKRKTKKKRTS